MRLPENWPELFYQRFEAARLREHARLAKYDRPILRDPTGLGALLLLVKRIDDVSHGLTDEQLLALGNALLDLDHEIRRRIGRARVCER
ncbi:hypothetical protein [Bradyrhizobium diazoefficiens]